MTTLMPNVTEVSAEILLEKSRMLLEKGYRFVTISCTSLADRFELVYHFDKNYNLEHLRLKLAAGESLPSISRVCFPAVVIENEIKDMFGVEITGMILDFGGLFLLSDSAPKAPQSVLKSASFDVRIKEKNA